MLKKTTALVLMLIIMIGTSYAEGDATIKSTVRVGSFGYGSSREIFDTKTALPISSFSDEYLQEIGRINNWEYDYVNGSLQQCLDRLASGEIDLVGPLQYSEERAKIYDFTEIEFGYDYSALYCYANANQFFYEDFSNFDNMKVGIVKGNHNEAAFNELCEEKGFSVRLEYYSDNATLVEALEKGRIEAMVAGRIVGSKIVKTLATFAVEKYYYATTKGNEQILNQLNDALNLLKRDNPAFEATLYDKYYPNGNIKGDMRLTRDEYNYLQKNKVINIAAYPDWRDVCYFDETKDDYAGIVPDISNKLSNLLGIRMRYNKSSTYYEAQNSMGSRNADVLLVVNDVYNKNLLETTKPFLEIPLLLVGYDENTPQSELRIALTTIDQYTSILHELPKNAGILECLNSAGTLDAVKNGEAEATIMDECTLDYLNKTGEYGQLKVIKALPSNMTLSFGVRKNADPNMLSTLNKAIGQLDRDDIERIKISNTTQRVYRPSWQSVVWDFKFIFIIAGVLVAISFVFVYIYHRKRVEKETNSVAYTDTLLGIRNFEKFKIDSDSLFNKFKRDDFSLIYFDVNKFKYINDNFGYKVGNDILRHVADCAKDLLYEYEIFARVSSDNFVLLLKNTDEKQIIETIKKLSRLAQSHPSMREVGHQITLCFGIYRLPAEKEDFYTSLDRANAARKTIKGSYHVSYAFYNEKMLRQLSHEVELGSAMAPAMENNEFKLFLQAKHSVETQKIIGAEALVRWDNPQKGIIQPNDFIPLMEKNGFIAHIDFFIFEEVCKALRYMIDNNFTVYPISVNLSRLHMQSRTFIHKLNDIAVRYNVPTSLIELELTETMILQNQKEVLSIMHALKELGFNVSLDDFGTGYSSLSLLMEMPVDVLKLDKSFLRAVIATPKERTILNDIINMAHHLNMKVVCEGVETKEQLVLLSEINCDIAQGYLFSKPLPVCDYYNYVL